MNVSGQASSPEEGDDADWIAGWMGSRAGLENVEKRKIS
jgi:hypothetical protein